MPLNFNLKNGVITGNQSGKPLHVTIQHKSAGAFPSPGRYFLQAPLKDPVFGMYSVLVPSAKIPPGATQARFKCIPWSSADGSVFVMSDRTIPARNNLLVILGFSNLMDMAQANDGVWLEVG